ncbi:phosphoenolpyruvate carboxylase [Vulcanisaeta thermophila]|uniref:phosphoenolpyruvate carboxylase n=1 Tax=Vulcanisaeta thermophila TaxID=867917 RepID=UPI0008529B60|nr:phosphoenolpyruvate carboxylase [Vulcanisaeta thermophila]
MKHVPRTLCTQHPDYANVPQWVMGDFIQGDDEVHEAYLAYSYYGCHEVMWDFEGKDADIYVVRKLLSKYSDFFRGHVLGEDVYLTLRLPNPWVEVAERKVFVEALELIPTANDVAREFYGRDVNAVFQVILPLTSKPEDLIITHMYYKKVVVGKEGIELIPGVKVLDIIGEVKPRFIDVIPLIEDLNSMLNVDRIITGYWKVVRPRYVRLFIARSDPAMNYGLIPAVLMAKVALSRALTLGSELGLPIYPMIGVGPTPFRGHLNPLNVNGVLREYPCVYTFTIQSAFRYDYPDDTVKKAIDYINNHEIPGQCQVVDEAEVINVISKYIGNYQGEVEGLANLINTVSQFIPPRRTRKLHVGLFGYSRGFRGVTLPRAITFVGALYSVGLPPELMGLRTLRKLSDGEFNAIVENYLAWRFDVAAAAKYACWECIDMIREGAGKLGVSVEALNSYIEDLKTAEELGIHVGPSDYESRKHVLYSQLLINSLIDGKTHDVRQYVSEMMRIRHAVG